MQRSVRLVQAEKKSYVDNPVCIKSIHTNKQNVTHTTSHGHLTPISHVAPQPPASEKFICVCVCSCVFVFPKWKAIHFWKFKERTDVKIFVHEKKTCWFIDTSNIYLIKSRKALISYTYASSVNVATYIKGATQGYV